MCFYALLCIAWLLLFPLSPRWGDDQFLGGLYFLPFPYHSTSGMPSGAAFPLGGFFYFGRFPWRMVTSYEKRLCTSVSFLSQSKRPRPYSPPKGGGTASGLCMGLAKSSKGGVRPQHFSVREGHKERFDNKRSLLEAQPLTRSWTYRQARAASPEPASLSWAGNPNA